MLHAVSSPLLGEDERRPSACLCPKCRAWHFVKNSKPVRTCPRNIFVLAFLSPPPDFRLAGACFIFGHKLGALAHFSFHLNVFFASDRSNFVSALCLDIQIECCADVRMTQ